MTFMPSQRSRAKAWDTASAQDASCEVLEFSGHYSTRLTTSPIGLFEATSHARISVRSAAASIIDILDRLGYHSRRPRTVWKLVGQLEVI